MINEEAEDVDGAAKLRRNLATVSKMSFLRTLNNHVSITSLVVVRASAAHPEVSLAQTHLPISEGLGETR